MFGLSCFYFVSRFLCIFAAFLFIFGKEYEPTDVCAKLNNKKQSGVGLLAYKLSGIDRWSPVCAFVWVRIIISFESKPSTENLFIPSDDGENVRSSAMLKSCIFSSQLSLITDVVWFSCYFCGRFCFQVDCIFCSRKNIRERELIADFGSQILWLVFLSMQKFASTWSKERQSICITDGKNRNKWKRKQKQQQHDQRATVASEYLLVWDWQSEKKNRSKQQKNNSQLYQEVSWIHSDNKQSNAKRIIVSTFLRRQVISCLDAVVYSVADDCCSFFFVFRTNQAIVYCSIELNGGSLLFHSIRWRCETPTSLVEFTVFLWSFPYSDYAERVLVRALIALYAIWSESF